MTYADAVAALYRSSQEQFVSERKRLAAELKAAGDKAGAAQLGKLARPTLSAWAVNQLWWQARELFDELLATGERLRQGELAASASHREALAALRSRAAGLLTEGGHAVNDATLRRVATTLSALAATGSFDPDPPGALSADRDPPGFDALGSTFAAAPASATSRPVPAQPNAARAPEASISAAPATPLSTSAASAAATRQAAEARRQAEERQRQKEEAVRREEAERQAARARREAERRRLGSALELARGQLAQERALVERLDAELGVARQALERSRDAILELEQQLARLGPGQS